MLSTYPKKHSSVVACGMRDDPQPLLLLARTKNQVRSVRGRFGRVERRQNGGTYVIGVFADVGQQMRRHSGNQEQGSCAYDKTIRAWFLVNSKSNTRTDKMLLSRVEYTMRDRRLTCMRPETRNPPDVGRRIDQISDPTQLLCVDEQYVPNRKLLPLVELLASVCFLLLFLFTYSTPEVTVIYSNLAGYDTRFLFFWFFELTCYVL